MNIFLKMRLTFKNNSNIIIARDMNDFRKGGDCMENIRKLRESKNMTQTQVAEKMSVDQTTVAKWEQDGMYPRASLLPALADLFDCSIDELYGRGDET